MKKLLILAAMPLLASCLNPAALEQQEERVITFSTSSVSTTRASLQEVQMTDLWVFVDDVLKVHQTSADADFGSPSLSLSHGEHVLKFLASKGTDPSFDNGIMTWSKAHDTFAKEVSLTVDDNTSAIQTVRLDRIVAKLQLLVKDKLPEGVATITLILSKRSTGFDVSGMSALNAEEIEQTFQIGDWEGKQGTKYTVYSLQTDEECVTDVSVILTDTKGNELANRTIENVPLTRNTTTILQGYLLDADINASIGADGEWNVDNEVEF